MEDDRSSTWAANRLDPHLLGHARIAILVIILITCFMFILDNSIIFTGLPPILTWVQDA